jgi:hypothetical protein
MGQARQALDGQVQQGALQQPLAAQDAAALQGPAADADQPDALIVQGIQGADEAGVVAGVELGIAHQGVQVMQQQGSAGAGRPQPPAEGGEVAARRAAGGRPRGIELPVQGGDQAAETSAMMPEVGDQPRTAAGQGRQVRKQPAGALTGPRDQIDGGTALQQVPMKADRQQRAQAMGTGVGDPGQRALLGRRWA